MSMSPALAGTTCVRMQLSADAARSDVDGKSKVQEDSGTVAQIVSKLKSAEMQRRGNPKQIADMLK